MIVDVSCSDWEKRYLRLLSETIELALATMDLVKEVEQLPQPGRRRPRIAIVEEARRKARRSLEP